jgi:hypothetical protein
LRYQSWAHLWALFETLCGEGSDAISLLRLEAWQASRNRPAVRAQVGRQMEAWQQRLAGLIHEVVATGEFRVSDAEVAEMRILALIDGMSVQAAIPQRMGYQAVRDMVIRNTERELGCRPAAWETDPRLRAAIASGH